MSDVAPESGAAQLPLQPQIIPIPSDSGPPPSAPTAARTIRGGRERGGGYRRRRDVGATRSPTSVVAPNSRGRFDGLRSSWWFGDVVPEEGFGRARRPRTTLCRRWGGVRSSGEKDCRLLRSAGSCSGTRPSAAFIRAHRQRCIDVPAMGRSGISRREGLPAYGDPLAWARGRAHRARSTLDNVVPEEGFEPSHSEEWEILSLLRLPFRHSGPTIILTPIDSAVKLRSTAAQFRSSEFLTLDRGEPPIIDRFSPQL